MKKKLLSLSLVAVLVIVAITGATIAYLTDEEGADNTFAIGNVDITLTEANVTTDANGDIVASEGRTEDGIQYGDISNLYPGQTVCKDPTIENVGSEDAYVAARITVTAEDTAALAATDVIGSGYKNLLDITKIISGGLVKEGMTPVGAYNELPIYGDGTYHIYQQIEDGAYVFYIFFEAPMATGDTAVLFEQLNVPAEWDNEELAALEGLAIDVDAFATQVYGFETCLEAMTTAFADDFAVPADLY